jgi:uncharacterized protein
VSAKPPPVRTSPPRHKLAVLTWLAIYPTVTTVSAVLQSVGLTDVPLPIRTMAITLIVVPVVVFFVAPALTRLFGPWLRAGHRSSP